MITDNKNIPFESNVAFNEICKANYCDEEEFNLETCVRNYANYLIETKNINIEYFIENCNNYSILPYFIEELSKNGSNGDELLKVIALMVVSKISEQPEVLVPKYARSEFRKYEVDNYNRPLDIFITSSAYYYCQTDVLLLIVEVYKLDAPLFFSLIEQIKSKYLIQEFILRSMIKDSNKNLLAMIKNAPSVVESDLKTWNNSIAIFVLLTTGLEKLKQMWLNNNHNSEIKSLIGKICDILYSRQDKEIIIYSFSAYLIRMLYFPNTELSKELKAYSDIANYFLENFENNAKFSSSINEVFQYIRGADLKNDEKDISNFRETGKLTELSKDISEFYPLLVFIALSPNQDEETYKEIILHFEKLLTYNDNFYYELSKNVGDLGCYHFYIASIYGKLPNPVEHWQRTFSLLNQLISRWHFNIFSPSSNSELKIISFFLHVGIALADILSNPEIESDKNNTLKLCDCIWDNYKNLIISIGNAYWSDLHITVTYIYIFMCNMIDFNNKTDLDWLNKKLSDFHSFPGIQLQILSNLDINGIDSNHKIRKYNPIKKEFENAISSLGYYDQLLDLDNRKNRYEYVDRDINVYKSYIDSLNKKTKKY